MPRMPLVPSGRNSGILREMCSLALEVVHDGLHGGVVADVDLAGLLVEGRPTWVMRMILPPLALMWYRVPMVASMR